MYKTELLTMEKFGNGCRMALTFSYAVTSSIWPKMFTEALINIAEKHAKMKKDEADITLIKR